MLRIERGAPQLLLGPPQVRFCIVGEFEQVAVGVAGLIVRLASLLELFTSRAVSGFELGDVRGCQQRVPLRAQTAQGLLDVTSVQLVPALLQQTVEVAPPRIQGLLLDRKSVV